MSNSISSSDIVQAVLFSAISGKVLAAAAKDLRECRWSREEVAERLSFLLARKITVAQIDALIAESKPHRFPAEWIPAWVKITGSARLLALLCEESGYWLADETEHNLAQLSRTEIERDRADRRVAELRARLEDLV